MSEMRHAEPEQVPSETANLAKSAGNFIRSLSPRQKRWMKNVFSLIILGLAIFLLIRTGISNMESAYHSAEDSIYDAFYQTAYEFAEAQNHVSNRVAISIEKVREVSHLQVLVVSGSEFVIKDADENDKTTAWLEVQGTGVFTIDLSAGEFIADSERQYVIVKVPKPMLTECKITNTNILLLKDGRIISNGSVAEGVDLAQAQLSEGQLKLADSMKQNRRFYEAAQETAKQMIESLVYEWNPDVPDLQVEVEFVENP